jgi:Zn-dependent protease with chaperone function
MLVRLLVRGKIAMLPQQILGAGLMPPAPRPCPVCGKPVMPDAFGFVECTACGWGGSGDPLEGAKGASRFLTGLDRRISLAQAQGDLARLAAQRDKPLAINPLYTLLLLLVSTLVYLLVLGIAVGTVALIVWSILDQAWLGLIIGVLLLALLILAYWEGRFAPKGIRIKRDRFPLLYAAIDDVSARTGLRLPSRVLLVPGTVFFVAQTHPLRRLFWRERTLGIGVGALPLMSEVEMKAIIAHEMAHYGHMRLTLHRYYAGAERALAQIVRALQDAISPESRARSRYMRFYYFGGYHGNIATSMGCAVSLLIWIITLPIQIVLRLFHLLRLHESRTAEYEADRVAVRAFGPVALANGLTSVITASNTLARGVVGGDNLYEALRKHYANLPPAAVAQLRAQSTRDFRSLEDTHPTTPDRIRAAFLVGAANPGRQDEAQPAVRLIVPDGESDASAVERQLSAMLRGGTRRRR